MITITPNDHWIDDFLGYYQRAALLQEMNHGGRRRASVGDELQDTVTIYDTVKRRYAGFSNVLRDLWSEGTEHYKDCSGFELADWLYVYGVHRMTGSGASFFPPSAGDRRHGYCNSCIFEITSGGVVLMSEKLRARLQRKEATFTSYGNQPPPFPKPPEGFVTGGQYYLCEIWPKAVEEIAGWVEQGDPDTGRWGVAELTEKILSWNVEHGFKRFKFTLAALAMDLADWHPQHVDPRSECHYGANAVCAMNFLFSDSNRSKGKRFYDDAMRYLLEAIELNKLHSYPCPMDVEDALCDAVRYWSAFIPQHGYEDAQKTGLKSSSAVPLEDFLSFCGGA